MEMLAAKKELAQKKIDSVLAKPPIVYTVPHERELADLKKELNSLKKIASQQKGKLMSGRRRKGGENSRSRGAHSELRKLRRQRMVRRRVQSASFSRKEATSRESHHQDGE